MLTRLILMSLSCQATNPEVEDRLAAQDARIAELSARVDSLVITTDATGRVTTTLAESVAVACAKGHLEGIATAQLAYDAAFDTFGDSFEQIGWQPSNQGDCAANVAFSMGPDAMRLVPDDRLPSVPLGVALITRGEGIGRVLAVDQQARVYEPPRVAKERVAVLLAEPEWTAGR
ncbi:MAG: hypothetical protein Q8P18_01895 [Pseudomonadota bacterium]|nr:hypothetical protein [Pseudomonadota bacterium]